MSTPAELVDVNGRPLHTFGQEFGGEVRQILAVINPQQALGLWQSVSWAAAVAKTPLISPDGDGSIEITDVLIAAEKKAGGSIKIHFEDSATNTKDVINTTVADGVVNVASNFVGKVQGWQGAILYYTIVGTYKGSVLITFSKHDAANSKTYTQMVSENGW